jgi:hypothetical protein
MANDTNVAVTPLARYLLRTTITNNDGARAQIPIIKLLTNSMAAVFLSRNRYKIRLFIIVVFNDLTIG